MTNRIFLHTLSQPEHLWLGFFRSFFQQQFLVFDDQDRTPLPNRFYYDQAVEPSNRPFLIDLAYDFDDSKQNALPALVIEDAGANQLGLTMDQKQTFSVSPETIKARADQVRFTYIFHCLSKDRGESRLLASIVTKAVTVFRDELLKNPPLVKIEPWSVGATQPMKTDGGGEKYCDTPVQITFYTMEFWRTLTQGEGTAEGFGVSFSPNDATRFIRSSMTVRDPETTFFIRASMALVNPSIARFINLAMTVDASLTVENFVRASLVTENPVSSERFIRASMRVS